MMHAEGLHYLDLVELTARIHRREISPVEVTEAQLARIERLDPQLRSYVLVTHDIALDQARAAEQEIMRGRVRGPLHGAPVAVKDLCWTAGLPTAAGMPIYRDFRPPEDATVVRRIREAGAVLLGKLQLTEGAFAEHHPDILPPLNPWHPGHWPGVSSSGPAVAAAAGLCYATIGSDTGGSIRFPSAANGLTGLKPTWGRISRHGCFELAASLDHIGPMARSAVDVAVLLQALAGSDPNDPTCAHHPVPDYAAALLSGVRGLRIGVDPSWNDEGVDTDTSAAVEQAVKVLAGLGVRIRRIDLPGTAEAVADWVPQCAVEAAVAHERTYPARKDAYGAPLAEFLEAGLALSGPQYQKILLRRDALRGRMSAVFEQVDLLAIPAQPYSSPTLERMRKLGDNPDQLAALLRYTAPFNLTGNPTITLPCGFTRTGMPLGFQLVARHFAEEVLLQAAHAYQTATDWHRQHPAL